MFKGEYVFRCCFKLIRVLGGFCSYLLEKAIGAALGAARGAADVNKLSLNRNKLSPFTVNIAHGN